MVGTRFLIWAWLTAAAPVFAQAPDNAPQEPAPTSAKRDRPRRIIRAEETKVEGRIQKPQAFYILQRSNLSFEDFSGAESFVPRIEKTVEKEPF